MRLHILFLSALKFFINAYLYFIDNFLIFDSLVDQMSFRIIILRLILLNLNITIAINIIQCYIISIVYTMSSAFFKRGNFFLTQSMGQILLLFESCLESLSIFCKIVVLSQNFIASRLITLGHTAYISGFRTHVK